MSEGGWRRFCLVGIGGHARNRLIPALVANGQEIAGLVSSKPASALPDAPVFPDVAVAVAGLPPETAFIIASPPSAHSAQAEIILRAGRDLIVEKPSFVTRAEAESAAAIADSNGAVLVEGFMNRYTRTHRRFLGDCANIGLSSIEATFTIPAAPPGTFRSDPAICASNLYDMTSYFLAALLDSGLSLDAIDIVSVDRPGIPDREQLRISGRAGAVPVTATIGIDDVYANRLTLAAVDGATMSYSPFFFGRAGPRTVIVAKGSAVSEQMIDDDNGFEAMLAIPRDQWLADQAARMDRMITLTAALERMGRSLLRFRTGD